MKRKAHFQGTLAAQASFEKYGRKSKREQFLDEMNEVVPWAGLLALVEPHYPKAGNGRRPVGLEIMLRAYFVQQWFNLSDPGVEDALYDSPSLRRFVGVDLGMAAAPDETTMLRFRHLLEEHELGGAMLDEVNRHLADKGIRITTGTIVDATIIHAPSSTKNSSGERDPEMTRSPSMRWLCRSASFVSFPPRMRSKLQGPDSCPGRSHLLLNTPALSWTHTEIPILQELTTVRAGLPI